MEIHPEDLNFKMMVNVPVSPPDFYRLNEQARILKISTAELIRRRLGIFSMASRKQLFDNLKNNNQCQTAPKA